jgi:NADH:ubiquinone oxidoreductase subunit K
MVVSLSAIFVMRDRNLIVQLLALELLFFALSAAYALVFLITPDPLNASVAIICAVVLIALAAAEAAVFLAIISRLYKNSRTIRLRG